MFSWYLKTKGIRKTTSRIFLVALIVLATASALLFYLLSATSLVTAQTAISDYWRISYDILVRPSNSKSSIETQYNLVEPNYLNSLNGGITFQQYEAIRSIPGVEIVAPVANLGTLPIPSLFASQASYQDISLQPPKEPGVYALVSELKVNEGYRTHSEIRRKYAIVLPGEETKQNYYLDQGLFVGTNTLPDSPNISLPLAAIDPKQEARLLNLDQSLIEGNYLNDNKIWTIKTETDPMLGTQTYIQNLPVLINETPYVSFSSSYKLEKVNIPGEMKTVDEIVALGGQKYLDTLPSQLMVSEGPYESQNLYAAIISKMKEKLGVSFYSFGMLSIPKKFTYQIEPSFPDSPDTLVIDSAPIATPPTDPSPDNSLVSFLNVGVFNLEKIPQPNAINEVPLETYFPPKGTLRYDEARNPLAPKEVLPTVFGDSRFTSPPLMLTTLENVMYPLIPYRKQKEIAGQATQLLKGVGLEKKLNQLPEQLSGGEQQRVAIARALINHPKIILADEPTGNLDSASGSKVMEILGGLHKEQNISLVLVTHDNRLAAQADRIIRLIDGKVAGIN